LFPGPSGWGGVAPDPEVPGGAIFHFVKLSGIQDAKDKSVEIKKIPFRIFMV
jgi:hypothetical protein